MAVTSVVGTMTTPAQRAAQPASAPTCTAEAQDVFSALVLCEAIYRCQDFGPDMGELAVSKLQKQVPGAPRLRAVQWSPPNQEQQYVVAETADALVVAFLGTKRPADHLVNLRLRHTPLKTSAAASYPSTAAAATLASFDAADAARSGAAPAAHSGYLRRAAAVPAEQLYALARVQGKRLVLAGHSLGGAVATLCALRLLDALPTEAHAAVSAVAFAAPPVGNAALAEAAAAAGWSRRVTNYLLPEDWVPGLLGLFARQAGGGGGSGAGAGSSSTTTTSGVDVDESEPSAGPAHDALPPHPLQTSSMLGGASTRILSALSALPRRLPLPGLVPIGRQELTFEVGPSPEESPKLQAALYAVTPDDTDTDSFLCGGSMSLAHLGDVGEQHNVRVPMVTAAGAHLADLSLDLRYFHSRSAGEHTTRPHAAARLLNERSSRSPTASPRPGSPRLKPPVHDPPVPAIEV
ncbi:cytochrome P450, partial [Micractinium conductrix]